MSTTGGGVHNKTTGGGVYNNEQNNWVRGSTTKQLGEGVHNKTTGGEDHNKTTGGGVYNKTTVYNINLLIISLYFKFESYYSIQLFPLFNSSVGTNCSLFYRLN